MILVALYCEPPGTDVTYGELKALYPKANNPAVVDGLHPAAPRTTQPVPASIRPHLKTVGRPRYARRMLGHEMTSDAYEAGLEYWRLGKFDDALRSLKFAARGSRYADPHPDAADKLAQLQALIAETDSIDVFQTGLSFLLGEEDTP